MDELEGMSGFELSEYVKKKGLINTQEIFDFSVEEYHK